MRDAERARRRDWLTLAPTMRTLFSIDVKSSVVPAGLERIETTTSGFDRRLSKTVSPNRASAMVDQVDRLAYGMTRFTLPFVANEKPTPPRGRRSASGTTRKSPPPIRSSVGLRVRHRLIITSSRVDRSNLSCASPSGFKVPPQCKIEFPPQSRRILAPMLQLPLWGFTTSTSRSRREPRILRSGFIVTS